MVLWARRTGRANLSPGLSLFHTAASLERKRTIQPLGADSSLLDSRGSFARYSTMSSIGFAPPSMPRTTALLWNVRRSRIAGIDLSITVTSHLDTDAEP